MWWYFLLCFPWTGKQSQSESFVEMESESLVEMESESLVEMESVVRACNQFGFDLHHQLQSSDDNVFFSPYSICAAFAMALLGANGNTAKQLRNTFHYKENLNVHMSFNELIWEYEQQNSKNYTLKTASKIFLSNDYEVKPTYQKMMQNYYAVTLQQLLFGTGEAEVIINKWIEEQTNNLIKDIFPVGSLQSDTRFVLANAIYFKGTWQKSFDKESTSKEKFHLLNGNDVLVDMMSQTEMFTYLEDAELNAQILMMPYSGERLSMLIILPYERFGLPDVMKKLTGKKVMNLMDGGKKEEVYVEVPKFKLETEIDLKSVLPGMNLTDIFNERSDLSKISNEPLFISNVKHKAFVQVDEEGTEAAAVTVMTFVLTSLPEDSKSKWFVCDHPFYFAIFDNTNKFILFSGIIVKPTNE